MKLKLLFSLLIFVMLAGIVNAGGDTNLTWLPDGYSTNASEYILVGKADNDVLSKSDACITVSSGGGSPNGTNAWTFACGDADQPVIGVNQWDATSSDFTCEFYVSDQTDGNWHAFGVADSSVSYGKFPMIMSETTDFKVRSNLEDYPPTGRTFSTAWTWFKFHIQNSTVTQIQTNVSTRGAVGTGYVTHTNGLALSSLTGMTMFDNGGDSTRYMDEIICYEGMTPPTSAAVPVPPTASDWDVTSGNTYRTESTSSWNINNTVINITNGTLSYTFTCSAACNHSAYVDVATDYSVADANHKAATTETISQANTAYDTISVGDHYLYISLIGSNGLITNYIKNFTYLEVENINFTYTPATEYGEIVNSSLWGNWTGTWEQMQNNISALSSGTLAWFALEEIKYGDYMWNVQVCGEKNLCNFTSINSTFTVPIDTDEGPNVTLNEPLDNANIYYYTQKDDGMKLNFSATNDVGLKNCSLWLTDETNSNFKYNQTYSNSTPLVVDDLTDIDISGLTNQSYGSALGIVIVAANANETAGSIIGQIAVDQDTYTDGTGIISPLYVQLTISEGVSLPNIYTGDTINITYDSGKTTKIYLPESSATQAYYIGGDGSTWNSINTTTYKLYDLAYPAPPLNNTITNFNVIFSRGIYTWNVQCYDNISQVGWGINRTFNITNTAPTWIANISNTTQLEDFTTFTYLDNLTSYVTDLDGDTVTFSIQDENTSQVNCAIVGTQNLTLTSVTNWYGNSTCSVGITDSLVYGENNTFGIEVTSVNDNPYFDPALINKSTNTSTTFIYDINCTDVDVGAVVTYYDNTTIFDINSTTGEISQLVNEKWRGNNSILITCGDGIVNTSSPFVLEVNDTTAPRYVSSVATELTIDFCAVNGTETINATFDDWYLDSSSTVYFAHNDTGIWVNTSATFEVSENASRHTWSYSIPAGWSNPGEKNYRFIAIDNANNINATGMDISEFYITKNISTLTLYLNGQAIDRKYELGTTANLTGTLNSCGGAGTVWLDISDPNYGVNYTSGTNGEVSYDYQILNIAETEFSDGTTSKNLTYVPGNQTFDIELMGESTFSTAHVYPYGYLNTTYPSNLVVDIFQDGTIDAILPGTLIGNTTNQSTFSAGVTTENLTFPVASSIVRWINFSTNQENDFFGFSLPNITIDLSGGAIDPVGVDYYDYFDNTSYPYSVNTCQGPSYIWDDFSQGDVVDRWSGDYTITASTYIRGDDEYCTAPLVYSGSEGSCNAAGSCETTTYFNSETLVLEDRPSTTFKLVHSTVLSSANFGLCSKSVSCKSHATTGILDKTTNIYAIMRSSSDTNTFNGIVEIKRENGFLKWYQDDIYMKQMSYNSTHQYEIKSTVTFVQRRNERGTVTCHGAVYIYPINVSGSAGAGGMGNYAECKMEYTDLLDVTGGGVPISRGIFEFDSEEIGSAGTYTLYLSADNGSNWEEVTNGLSHVFTNVGTMLAGKLVLNTTVSTDTVVAKEVHISVVPGFASGIGIDVGYDGDTEWNMTAQLNATTSPQHITLDATDLYTDISDCTGLTCLVPIVFKVDTAGTLTYSNITIKQQFGKIFLNVTAINNNLTDIVGLSNITIGVGSDTAGIVELSDLTVDYKGDATYSINAHFEGNENYSVANDTHDLSWRYSPITLTWPSRITSYNVYPSTINSKNVEPLGQKTKLTEAESVPIFNITTTARTDNVKIYSLFDPAIDSCLTLNECLYVNKSLCIPTNTTGQLLVSDLAPGEEANLYHYWNLTNCDPSNIYLPTNFSHRPYCQDCVYTGE